MNSTSDQQPRSILAQLRALHAQHFGGPSSARLLAELQAETLLRLTGYQNEQRTPSEVVSHLPRVQIRLADMPTSGLSVWDGDRWVISLNRFEPATRQRFTLLHEYKHIIDHPHCDWLYHDRAGTSALAQAEQAADYFAGCVLMPGDRLRRAWTDGQTSLQDLARRFDVSAPAIQVRLRQLGLARAVVMPASTATRTTECNRGTQRNHV